MARLAEAEAPPVGLLCSLVAVLPLEAVDGVDCVWLCMVAEEVLPCDAAWSST